MEKARMEDRRESTTTSSIVVHGGNPVETGHLNRHNPLRFPEGAFIFSARGGL